MGWAGARPGRRWLSPVVWGSDPWPRGQAKGPPPRQATSSDWGAGGALAGPARHPSPNVGLICLQTPLCAAACGKIIEWGAFSLKPASEVASWGLRSTCPQGPTHLAEPEAGRPQSGSFFCFGEKSQGGVGWGWSKAQAWLRVGLALELVPESGVRTLSSDWPSVAFKCQKEEKILRGFPIHWLQDAGTCVPCWVVGRKPNLKGSQWSSQDH